jgi:hypothetical protein
MDNFSITQEIRAAEASAQADETRLCRWRILRILAESSRVYGSTDDVILRVFVRVYRNLPEMCPSLIDVRRMLEYLREKKFVKIVKGTDWEVSLLPAGIEFMENPYQQDAGILRGDV